MRIIDAIQQLHDSGNTRVVIMRGSPRMWCVGDTCYRFTSEPINNYGCFIGRPVSWVDGQWVDSQLGKPIALKPDDEVTVVWE